MIVENIEQRSPEWFKARCGIPSASNFDKIVDSKGNRSKQRKAYLYKLAGERILGIREETYQSSAMARGIEMESEARALFELLNGVEVKQVGVCYPDERKQVVMSPDGLIDEAEEGIELKCPMLHTHVEYLLKDKLPTKYVQQVQGSMLISGYESWWFMSYYPGMPPLILPVSIDEDFISKLYDELLRFIEELEQIEKKLKQ